MESMQNHKNLIHGHPEHDGAHGMSDVLELIGAAVNVTKSVNFVKKSAKLWQKSAKNRKKSAKNRQKIGKKSAKNRLKLAKLLILGVVLCKENKNDCPGGAV
jgi:hypothetical protein